MKSSDTDKNTESIKEKLSLKKDMKKKDSQ